MEEGSLRCDANISLRPVGQLKFGTRTEIKNLNSFKFVERALEYEIARQLSILKAGQQVIQQTLLFDSANGTTRPLRSKEESSDYRYFPDPDLLPLVFDDAFVADCRASLPELPAAKRARYESTLGLSPYLAAVLSAEKETADWFETALAATAAKVGQPVTEVALRVANFVSTDLFGALKKLGKGIGDSPVSPDALAELLALAADGTLSGPLVKQVFEAMLETGEGAANIVEQRGLKQVSDTGAIDAAIQTVMDANPDKVAEYRSGKDKLFGFFVGQVMRAMAGKAAPGVVNDRLKALLDG
jgi:aspartyl-tRNA(Asn)/glutamyl-tRNA(Gln) amidotransferase subunit B